MHVNQSLLITLLMLLIQELRSVQIEDDEMEMSDDDRNYQGSGAKRTRYDADSLKVRREAYSSQAVCRLSSC